MLFHVRQADVGSAAPPTWQALLHADSPPCFDQEADALKDNAVVTAASYSAGI